MAWELSLWILLSFLTFTKAWLHWQYFLVFQHESFERNPIVYFEKKFSSKSSTFTSTILVFWKFLIPFFIPENKRGNQDIKEQKPKLIQLIVVVIIWWFCLLPILTWGETFSL